VIGGAALGRLSPWSAIDAARCAALVAAGAVVTGVGWWRTAGEAAWDHQITPVAIALSGFGIAAFGVVSWLLRARAVLLDRRAALLSDERLATRGSVRPDERDLSRFGAATTVVAHRTDGRFHRPGCSLAAGRSWSTLDRAELEDEGRSPCGICRP
jgi:hypothetical protein